MSVPARSVGFLVFLGAAVALVSGCPSDPTPCICPPASSSAAVVAPAPSASASRADGGTPDDAGDGGCPTAADDDNAWCSPGEESYGAWTAAPEQVVVAMEKLKQGCAYHDWLLQAGKDCMARLGRSNVVVMSGVMSGDTSTPRACTVAVSSVEWQGRRWIAFRSGVKEDAAFFGFTSAMEMKPSGPVQVTLDCQGSPTASTGPYGKRPHLEGWKTFPKDLQERLCHP